MINNIIDKLMKPILYLTIVIVVSIGSIIPTYAQQIPSELTSTTAGDMSGGEKNGSLALLPQNTSVIETAKTNTLLEARQINPINLYLVLGDFTDSTTTFDVSRAICNAGDIVIEGGYTTGFSQFFSANDIIRYNGPQTLAGSTAASAYQVTVSATGTNIGSYQAFAYCLDNSP